MKNAETQRIAVIVGSKGRGSNMAALVKACQSGLVPAEVVLVVASGHGSDAEKTAQDLGVPTLVVPAGENYGERLSSTLKDCDWLCLAGFLRILPGEVLKLFPDRVLNIHPSLLPKFGGKGMYGHHVHEAVLAAGERESGCTVHYVNEHYDDGKIILQKRCVVEPGDTPETLAARVLVLEHKAYPEALAKVIDERSR
jgi:phosphoribosylglycinamide formyltransferase-1